MPRIGPDCRPIWRRAAGKEIMRESACIRRCLEADIARTGRFYDSVVRWLEGHVNYPRWIYGVYPSEESVRAFTGSGSQYICEDGESILAAFVLSAEPQGSYRKGRWSRDLADGSYMVIQALAVDPELQRQGTGAEIVRYCIDRTKADGYQALRVDIVPTNVPARSLFEKNGFLYVGDADLELDIGDIPAFSLYEYNF